MWGLQNLKSPAPPTLAFCWLGLVQNLSPEKGLLTHEIGQTLAGTLDPQCFGEFRDFSEGTMDKPGFEE